MDASEVFEEGKQICIRTLEGDFLAVRKDDLKDVYIIEKTIFYDTYEKI